jgi:broad specificity phosphatase PhoE
MTDPSSSTATATATATATGAGAGTGGAVAAAGGASTTTASASSVSSTTSIDHNNTVHTNTQTIHNTETQAKSPSSVPTTTKSAPKSAVVHRRRTLYLVRHGEAVHNVQEKQAQDKARQQAIAQGITSESEIQQRMETARKAVLQDPTLFDAPLTQLGQQQAQQAAQKLLQIIHNGIALPPTEAMVSPLTRCLQTIDIILNEQRIQVVQDTPKEEQPDDDTPPTTTTSNINNNPPSQYKNIMRSDSEYSQVTLDNNNNNNNDQEEEQQQQQQDGKEGNRDVQQSNNNNNTSTSIPAQKLVQKKNPLSSSIFAVHIRPEIQERQTQYPPDTPQTPDVLFHWTQQQLTHNIISSRNHNNNNHNHNNCNDDVASHYQTVFHAKALTGQQLAIEESRTQLRERALKLFDILLEMKHRRTYRSTVLCIYVTRFFV